MMHQRIEPKDGALIVENMGDGVLVLLQRDEDSKRVQNVVVTVEDLKRLKELYL